MWRKSVKVFLIIGAAIILQTNSLEEPKFAVEFYNSFKTNENVVISPYSIYSCLGLAFMGAAGETENELRTVLHFGNASSVDVFIEFEKGLRTKEMQDLIQVSNIVIINNSTTFGRSSINKVLKDLLQTRIKYIDLSNGARYERVINEWIKVHTKNGIKRLFSQGSIDKDTSALLINAIYFKAEWESPFPSTNSKIMNFYSDAKNFVQVEFMSDEDNFNYGSLEDIDSTAVEMKYTKGNFSMIIILPNKKNGLTELLRKPLITGQYLMNVPKRLSEKKIEIYIPKFSTEFELDLKEPLGKLGIKSLFTRNADLSKFLENPSNSNIMISKALHKAIIKVDEEGTEASASTYLKAYEMSLNFDPKIFKADHPFLWYIKNNENIYFMGQVTNFD